MAYPGGAGRNPDAADWPGAGRTTGRGPMRGLKGALGDGGGDVAFLLINCGLVRFKQLLNSTVHPRYGEHLDTRGNQQMFNSTA